MRPWLGPPLTTLYTSGFADDVIIIIIIIIIITVKIFNQV